MLYEVITQTESPPATPAPTQAAAATAADVAVTAVEEGKDIAWVYASKDSLAGQPVTLRGTVVKYNPNILGWNFLHIQDGSGSGDDGVITSYSIHYTKLYD